MQEGFVVKGGADIAESDMKAINRYTRRDYTADEVYTFSLVLCDNEIDRDFERFSTESLEKLKELFLGKTCILDHERKSANQTARIYSTEIETVRGRITRSGEVYTRLAAKAYLPKTESTAETVSLIDSGILKEVSVSCSVKRSVCSICGKETCGHQRGREYGGRLCCKILQEPTDAYECSFVAVPAQREAGVRKSLHSTCNDDGGLQKVKNSGCQAVRLTAAEADELREKILQLEEKAKWGEKYENSMKENILRLGALAQPELPREILKAAIENLSAEQLKAAEKAFSAAAAKCAPLFVQTAGKKPKRTETNGEYVI